MPAGDCRKAHYRLCCRLALSMEKDPVAKIGRYCPPGLEKDIQTRQHARVMGSMVVWTVWSART